MRFIIELYQMRHFNEVYYFVYFKFLVVFN